MALNPKQISFLFDLFKENKRRFTNIQNHRLQQIFSSQKLAENVSVQNLIYLGEKIKI